MKTLLITRPRDDADELASALKARGFRCLCEPMLTIEFIEGSENTLADALKRKHQAILTTSRHAIGYLARFSRLRSLPLFVVGKASAVHAAKLGFTDVREADGTAKTLVKTVRSQLKASNGSLLYLRGQNVSTDIVRALGGSRFKVESVILYRARRTEQFTLKLRRLIEADGIDAVLFFSQRSLATYMELVHYHSLTKYHARISALCMGKAIAEKAAGINWKNIKTTPIPDNAHDTLTAGATHK